MNTGRENEESALDEALASGAPETESLIDDDEMEANSGKTQQERRSSERGDASQTAAKNVREVVHKEG